MCGRFVVANAGSELVGVLRVDIEGDDLPAPSYNIAPTDRVAIVLDSAKTEPPTRRLEAARWGLVPAWAKDAGIGSKAFNARAEEVEDKPMFRQALMKRRAVVPASGYYEWKTEDGAKTPYYIHPIDDAPLFFAGLYEWWKDPAKSDDDSIGALGSVHDRMPLFIDGDYADVWLDPTTENVGDLLDAAIDAAPALVDSLSMREVDRAVGNVRNNGPELIEPVS